MTSVETAGESQITPIRKSRLPWAERLFECLNGSANSKVDIYSKGEARRIATLLGFFSGCGGVFITAPLLSIVGEDYPARIAFMAFNYFSFSTAAMISGYRSVRRAQSLKIFKNTPLHEYD